MIHGRRDRRPTTLEPDFQNQTENPRLAVLKVIDLPDDANVLPIRYFSDISFFFSVVPIEPVVKIMVVHVVPTRYKTLAGTAHPMIY